MNKIIRFAMVLALGCGALLYTGCTKDFSQDVEKVASDVTELQATVDQIKSTVNALSAFKDEAIAALALKADKTDLAAAESRITDLESSIETLNNTARQLQAAIATGDAQTLADAKAYTDEVAAAQAVIVMGLINQLAEDVEAALGGLEESFNEALGELEESFNEALANATGSIAALAERVGALEEIAGKLTKRIQSISYVPAGRVNKYKTYTFNSATGQKAIVEATFKVVPEAYAAGVTADVLSADFVASRAFANDPFPAAKVTVASTDAQTGYVNVRIVVDSTEASSVMFPKYEGADTWNDDDVKPVVFALAINVEGEENTHIGSDFVTAVYDGEDPANALSQVVLYKGTTAQEDTHIDLDVDIFVDDTSVKTLIGDEYSVKISGFTIEEICDLYDLDPAAFKFTATVSAIEDAQSSMFNYTASTEADKLPVKISLAEGLGVDAIGPLAQAVWTVEYAPAGISRNATDYLARVKATVNVVPAFGTIFTADEQVFAWNAETANVDFNGLLYRPGEPVNVDGDMTVIAAENDYVDEKLATEDNYRLTAAQWATFKAKVAAKDASAYDIMDETWLGNNAGYGISWYNKNSLNVSIEASAISATGFTTEKQEFVYVSGYVLSDGKIYLVAVPFTIGAKPADIVVELEGTLAHYADSAYFVNMVPQIYAGLVEALDLDEEPAVMAAFLDELGASATTFQGFNRRAAGTTPAAGSRAYAIYGKTTDADTSKISVAVADAPYGYKFADSIMVAPWGVNIKVKLSATVEDAPEFALAFINDPRVSNVNTEGEIKTADVKASILVTATDTIPETVNLNQIVRISKNGQEADIVDGTVSVEFSVKETGTAYAPITITDSEVDAFTPVPEDTEFSTIDDDVAVKWNTATVSQFTVIAKLYVDDTLVDTAELTLKTEDPLAAEGAFAGYNWVVDASDATADIVVTKLVDSLTAVANTENITGKSLVVLENNYGAGDNEVSINADGEVAGIYTAFGDAFDAKVVLAPANTWYVGSDKTNLVVNNPTNFAVNGTVPSVTLKAGNSLVSDVVVNIPVKLYYNFCAAEDGYLESVITVTFQK